jgi:hypothetical protein
MIASFFDTPAKQELLRAVVASWQGTPYARFSQAKGSHGGIDCEKYAELVYVETGVLLAPVEVPRTEADYNLVAHNNRLIDFIRGTADDPRSAGVAERFTEFAIDEGKEFAEPPMIGDLVIGRNDTAAVRERGEHLWHVAVMIGPRKFTSCTVLGVREGMIQDPTYRRHFFAHFRPRPRA